MVTIDTRKVADYLEVKFEINDTKFDLGLLNKDARIELARNLSQAATDILDSI